MEQNQNAASNRRRYVFPLIVLAVCVALGGYLYWSQSNASGKYQKGADFSYQDIDGNTVTLENTNGSVRLLYFFFSYCPDVCPPTTFLMSQAQEELKKEGLFGDKVKFLSVTIDPERDTPERLREYAGMFDADFNGWKFLRGDEKETAELAKKYSILVTKDADGNFGHMNLFVLLDKKGNIREWISANDFILYGEDNRPLSELVDKIKALV
jgi:protein SCO1/2